MDADFKSFSVSLVKNRTQRKKRRVFLEKPSNLLPRWVGGRKLQFEKIPRDQLATKPACPLAKPCLIDTEPEKSPMRFNLFFIQ
jgi:hypothetical protein